MTTRTERATDTPRWFVVSDGADLAYMVALQPGQEMVTGMPVVQEYGGAFVLTSLVLVIPAALRDAGNTLGEALGNGSDTYNTALSPTGAEPATHYGARVWANEGFLDMLDAAVAGALPAPPGIPPEHVQAVAASIVQSRRAPEAAAGHFDAAIAEIGLARVQP